MGAARERGLEAGRDVAIVGYNDTPLAGALPIGLSTIHSPMHQMGRLGLELLLQKLAGGDPQPAPGALAGRARQQRPARAGLIAAPAGAQAGLTAQVARKVGR